MTLQQKQKLFKQIADKAVNDHYGKKTSFAVNITTAVAMHETALFNSLIFVGNSNAFGMKMPAVRETTAIKENQGYAYYKSVYDSIIDFLLWFDFHDLRVIDFTDEQISQFVKTMKEKAYFEDDTANYLRAVEAHYKKAIQL